MHAPSLTAGFVSFNLSLPVILDMYPLGFFLRRKSVHGRLGIGDSRCRHIPVHLKSWPRSFAGCTVKDVALGGAHSVVLAHRSVSITLANPWGIESVAYAWGYGFCGQLGLGQHVCGWLL